MRRQPKALWSCCRVRKEFLPAHKIRFGGNQATSFVSHVNGSQGNLPSLLSTMWIGFLLIGL